MYNPKSVLVLHNDNLITNFVAGTKCYINQEMNDETCSHMIADLYHIIEDPATRTIDIIINSPGGDVRTLKSIITCLSFAKKSGIIVNTVVSGLAASCASLLAVIGDNRIIGEYARHFIHFGTSIAPVTKETEIEKANIYNKEHIKFAKDIYLKYTNITKDKLDKIMEDEYGFLNAKDCKKYGFVDTIV